MPLTAIQEETARRNSVPFAKFQYVTVVVATAATDVDIPHDLQPEDPDAVRWLVVNTESTPSGGSLYRDSSASRLPWSHTRLWLRSTHAGSFRLLLFLEA